MTPKKISGETAAKIAELRAACATSAVTADLKEWVRREGEDEWP